MVGMKPNEFEREEADEEEEEEEEEVNTEKAMKNAQEIWKDPPSWNEKVVAHSSASFSLFQPLSASLDSFEKQNNPKFIETYKNAL